MALWQEEVSARSGLLCQMCMAAFAWAKQHATRIAAYQKLGTA